MITGLSVERQLYAPQLTERSIIRTSISISFFILRIKYMLVFLIKNVRATTKN